MVWKCPSCGYEKNDEDNDLESEVGLHDSFDDELFATVSCDGVVVVAMVFVVVPLSANSQNNPPPQVSNKINRSQRALRFLSSFCTGSSFSSLEANWSQSEACGSTANCSAASRLKRSRSLSERGYICVVLRFV